MKINLICTELFIHSEAKNAIVLTTQHKDNGNMS